MVEPPDEVLLRRRKRYCVANSLGGVLFSAVGILIAVYDGNWLGYFIWVFFGLAAIFWAIHLVAPPEVLLEMRPDHFAGLAPEFERPRTPSSEVQPEAKPTPPPSETLLRYGVWDRELDGSL